MSSELINYNDNYDEATLSALKRLSYEMFKGTLDYEDAKYFVEQHSKKSKENERFAFLTRDEELINGCVAISIAMSSTSIEHSYVPYFFTCLDGKDYVVIKYSEPKSQKTTNKLY